MAHEGQELVNAVTGQRIVFLTVPDDRQHPLVFEDEWTRAGHRVAAHVHPQMTERWEVLRGEVAFRIGDAERLARAGDVIVAPAGTTHMGRMTSEEPVQMRVSMTPALSWPEFTEELFALAERGLTDETGIPDGEALGRLLRRYSDEIAAPSSGT